MHNSKAICALSPSTRGDGFYRFIPWFVRAWEQSGGAVVQDIRCPRKIRAFFGRTMGFPIGSSRRKMLVCGSSRIEACAWPWNYFYEVVPVMWDLWPNNYVAFSKFIKRNHVGQVFCTAAQSVKWLRGVFPDIDVVWMPEAIDIATFPCGGRLCDRKTDVLCYGRCVSGLGRVLDDLNERRGFFIVRGGGATMEDLAASIRQAKVSICYPMCDTNPSVAQGVETLTQRYWEAMCSGALPVGRAPKELVDVCGYNPVIELGADAGRTLEHLIDHISDYQALADRNRSTAERIGDWTVRIKSVMGRVYGCG